MRSWSFVRLALATFAVATLLVGGAAAAHDHTSTPGLYNPECQLLALATLGGVFALAAIADALVVVPTASAAAIGLESDFPDGPHRGPCSRAPPASLD